MPGKIKTTKNLHSLVIYGHVAKILLELVEDSNGTQEIDKKLVASEFTRASGLARETMWLILKDLEEEGYIKISEEKIINNNYTLPG